MKKAVVGAVLALVFIFGINQASAAYEPIGYPYMSWGELSYPKGGNERGLKLDTYFEQGVNWFRVKKSAWIFSTFGALHLTLSRDPSAYWNNKIGPSAGFGFRRSFQLLPGSYQQLFIGVRGEDSRYFDAAVPEEWRGLVFVKWSAGGDWKRR